MLGSSARTKSKRGQEIVGIDRENSECFERLVAFEGTLHFFAHENQPFWPAVNNRVLSSIRVVKRDSSFKDFY